MAPTWKRQSASPDDAREDVPPELVRPEPVAPARARQEVGHVLVERVIGAHDGGSDRRHRQRAQQREREHGRRRSQEPADRLAARSAAGGALAVIDARHVYRIRGSTHT